jgi:hypothetical protein
LGVDCDFSPASRERPVTSSDPLVANKSTEPAAVSASPVVPTREETDTTSALEAITDAGLFERIAIAALRIDRPHYAISTLGVNADHKTVKAAVDALGRDRSSAGYHLVMAAHATSPREKLEKKWFYDCDAESAKLGRPVTGEDGDVVKAAQVAAEIRKENPSVKVTLVLTTNRVPSIDVLKLIPGAELQYDVEIEVFDRSSIAHVLEFTPGGVDVRRTLLGIMTDRLSPGLLTEIGRRSAIEYARWHPELGPEEWDDRTTAFGLSVLGRKASLVALVGPSGFGKSALALQYLKAHLSAGGVALWARAELVAQTSSLDGLLDLALREWYPALEPDAARRALLFAGASRPLVLVVDDVMRTPRPQGTIGTLYEWSKPASPAHAMDASVSRAAPIVIVVPVWPALWESIGSERASASWVRVVEVGELDPRSTVALLRTTLARRGVEVSEPEADEAARRLGGDPFLVSLFVALAAAEGNRDVLALARDTLTLYVERNLASLAGPGGRGTFTVSTYRRALELLSSEMLAARALEPRVEQVRSWFAHDSEAWRALTEMVRDGRLISEDAVPEDAVLRFRHDRLRDAALGSAMRRAIRADRPNLDLIADPLFAAITGAAITVVAVDEAVLAAVCERTPAALAESLRAAGSEPYANRDAVVKLLRRWAEQDALTGLGTARVEAAFRAIAASMVSEVPEILARLPANPGVALVRLAHGSIEDGVLALNRHGFDPAINDIFRDRSLALLLHRRREHAVADMLMRLEDNRSDERDTVAALTLAGFLGASELISAANEAWRRVVDREDAVLAGLWAMIRCAPAEHLTQFLNPLMDAWEDLSDEGQPPLGMSPRSSVSDELGRVFARVGLDDAVARFFHDAMSSRPALEWHLVNTLRRVDSPIALGAVLPVAAKVREKVRREGGFSTWLSSLASDWGGWSLHHPALSVPSREYLLQRWLDEVEPIEIRHEALRLWVVTASPDEAEVLRSICSDSPMFDTALWHRGLLGDSEALEPLLERVERDPWWYYASAPLWGARMRESLERRLSAWSSPRALTAEERVPLMRCDDAIRELLRRISPLEATEVLKRHWLALRGDEDFVALAVSLGTRGADALVAEAIASGVTAEKAVRFIGHRLGIRSVGETQISMSHLRSIEPYVADLGVSEQRDLADWCQRHARDWAYVHLVPLLSNEWRSRFFPTDDDLDAMWRERLRPDDQHWTWLFEHWVQDLTRDPAVRPRIIPLVSRQLEGDGSDDNFLAAAIALRITGSRTDIGLLERCSHGGNATRNAIVRDTRYSIEERTGDGYIPSS